MVLSVIDVSNLFGRNLHSRREVAKQICMACQRNGFFGMVGHGIPFKLRQQVLDLTREFFAQPLEEKMKISFRRLDQKQGIPARGYQKPFVNVTQGKPDAHEAIDFLRDLEFGELAGNNKWPRYPKELKQVYLEY